MTLEKAMKMKIALPQPNQYADPSPGYQLRPFRKEDLQACINLMFAVPDFSMVDEWTYEECKKWILASAGKDLDSPNERGWLAFKEGQLVSMALANSKGYVNQVYTLPEHQNRGLATACLTRVLESLSIIGMKEATVLVGKTNVRALSLYEKLGFSPSTDNVI